MLKDVTFSGEDTKINVKDRKKESISVYSESSELCYPMVKLSCDKLQVYKIDVLKGLIERKSDYDTSEGYYNTYLEYSGTVGNIGLLHIDKLRILLDDTVFSSFEKEVWLDKDTMVVGDMLYALCTTSLR